MDSQWFESTFTLEVHRRQISHSDNGPAFLILDDCSADNGPGFRQLCKDQNIIPIFLPPHPSNQRQTLDLSIFGTTKRIISRANRLEEVPIQIFHICRVVCSFLSAAMPINIVQSFNNAGISLVKDSPTILCTVTRTLRDV
jgi:hypothetical protein